MRARTRVLESKDLLDEERTLLENGSPRSVEEDLLELVNTHAKESRGRRFASKARIKPILDGLNTLDVAINPLTSLDSLGIAPLVWGGIKLICTVIMALCICRS